MSLLPGPARPALLALTILALAACGDPAPPAAEAPAAPEAAAPEGPAGPLVIYSGRDEMFVAPLLQLVKEQLPGVEVTIDYGKDPLYLDRLTAEKDAPRADLFLTKGSTTVEAAAAQGLLAPLPTDLLDAVPERFRGTGSQWVALSARARVLVVRKDLAAPPASILDLADPAWTGRIARTVATNSSFVGGVASAIADKGAEAADAWLRGLDANTADAGVFPKHTPAVAAVAAGKHDVALVNHYYFYRNVFGSKQDALTAEDAAAKLEAAPIRIVYPDADGTGVMWNVTGGAIVQGAPNAAAAQAVLELLLSPEGQKAYAWSNREYPVVDGVPAPPGVDAPDSFSWSKTTLPQLAEQAGPATTLIQTIGLR